MLVLAEDRERQLQEERNKFLNLLFLFGKFLHFLIKTQPYGYNFKENRIQEGKAQRS